MKLLQGPGCDQLRMPPCLVPRALTRETHGSGHSLQYVDSFFGPLLHNAS